MPYSDFGNLEITPRIKELSPKQSVRIEFDFKPQLSQKLMEENKDEAEEIINDKNSKKQPKKEEKPSKTKVEEETNDDNNINDKKEEISWEQKLEQCELYEKYESEENGIIRTRHLIPCFVKIGNSNDILTFLEVFPHIYVECKETYISLTRQTHFFNCQNYCIIFEKRSSVTIVVVSNSFFLLFCMLKLWFR